MNPTLWNLCQRDQLLALRDQARRQQIAGNTQAGYVAAWMEQVLSSGVSVAAFTAGRAFLNRASAAPAPPRFPHHAPEPMQTR